MRAEYEFVAVDFLTDEKGKADLTKPRALFVDDLSGKRVQVENGTRFVAELAPEVVVDRRGATPKEVPTGRDYVVSSDVNIHPGCLTSCIRTGRAKKIGDGPKVAKK